jgi:hypothetical protein
MVWVGDVDLTQFLYAGLANRSSRIFTVRSTCPSCSDSFAARDSRMP